MRQPTLWRDLPALWLPTWSFRLTGGAIAESLRRSEEGMAFGNCQLCGRRRDLKDSHILSKFGYKRYVSDLSKGGSFIDLAKGQRTNRQYTEYWFCWDCQQRISQSQHYVAKMLDKIHQEPDDLVTYDGRLLRFATSISLRAAMRQIGRYGLNFDDILI
jgi:hypothetical protein